MDVLLVPHNLIRFAYIILCTGIFSFGVLTASAAELVIAPNTGEYAVGDEITITVQADPQGASVRAVEAILAFDNTRFEVVRTSETGSVFTLWTTNPTFSNTTGTIEFGGGSQTPFSVNSNLVSITLRAIAGGTGRITVSNASIQSADGQGTEAYTGAVNAAYTLMGESATEPIEITTEETATLIPQVSSTAYADPEKWYATKTGVFTWEVPAQVTKLALEISSTSTSEPMTVYDPPITEFALTPEIVGEGVQYLVMQYKDDTEWRDILYRKIQIDTVSPEPFSMSVVREDGEPPFPRIIFEAQDTTSGIEKYEIVIPGSETITLNPTQATHGYLLTNLPDGTYTVKVVAYDYAGNIRESYATVQVNAGWTNPNTENRGSFLGLFMGKNLLIIVLLLIIIAQCIRTLTERRLNEHTEEKLRKETQEVQDQMEKIFSALRDEIYDQINMISKHEKLTKKEREAVEGLNQALAVSETLIEKEIGDVSKILAKKKSKPRKPRAAIVKPEIAPK